MDDQRTGRRWLQFFCGLLLGGTVQAQHFEYKEHHLGPTGLFGVTSPTDIKITKVLEGSPADGKIKVGDVLVAAGGIPFKEDTRPQLAAAIDQAETQQAKGLLSLTLKGGSKVDLQLKVLGSYSATAPYNCPKTEAIITQTADVLDRALWHPWIWGLSEAGGLGYAGILLPECQAAPAWRQRCFEFANRFGP